MELLGQVKRGLIVPQGDALLPEGATVRIVYDPLDKEPTKMRGNPIEFPLVRTGKPGALHLPNDGITKIFDEEDFSPRR